MEGQEWEERIKLNCFLTSSFFHSMVLMLGYPSKSAAKNGGGYYTNDFKERIVSIL
jgi:hypothetical protein